MAAEITKALGVKPELRKGSNGIFDIAVDGTIIFSKYRESRYPEATEIISKLPRPSASDSRKSGADDQGN